MGRKKTYIPEDVVRKAMHLFWEKGYEGSHLQELVEVTGVNRFGLYKEFGGKAGLFNHCLAYYTQEAMKYYQTYLNSTPLGFSNIEEFFLSSSLDNHKGCFFVNSITEKNILNPKAHILLEEFNNEMKKLFHQNIEAALGVESTLQSEYLSSLCVTFDLGLAVFFMENPNPEEAQSTITTFLESLKTLITSGTSCEYIAEVNY